MDRNRNRNNNNYPSPTIILAALLASMLALPTAVSAHGREGRDKEKMSSLLQSLFEMKARRAEETLASPQLNRAGPAAGTWSAPPAKLDLGVPGAPLSHESPPSPPYHLGLLRVSGAAASQASIRSQEGGGAGARTRGPLPSLAMLHGEHPPALDDGGVEQRHDFVRELRRQFELRQQRAHAEE
jgi:hypothetical protein